MKGSVFDKEGCRCLRDRREVRGGGRGKGPRMLVLLVITKPTL